MLLRILRSLLPLLSRKSLEDRENMSEKIDKSFNQILEAIKPVLIEKKFVIVEESRGNEAFGSRYIIFENVNEQIRLTWDGKGKWFVLETTVDPPSKYEYLSWADISLQFYKPDRDNDKVVHEIADDMRIALCEYFGDT
jgi:hypothetical protein